MKLNTKDGAAAAAAVLLLYGTELEGRDMLPILCDWCCLPRHVMHRHIFL